MIEKISNTFSHKFLIVLANFLVVSLTSSVLGSIGRGETNLFLTDFALIYLFSGILGGTTLSYFATKKDLFTISTLGYCWSFLMVIIGTPLLHLIHPSQYFLWLFGTALIQSLTMVNQKIVLGKNDLFSYNLNTAIQPITNLVYVYISYELLGVLTVSIFVKGFFFSSLFAFFISLLQARKYVVLFKVVELKQTFKEMFTYGYKSNYDNILETLNYRASFYFLFWFGFTEALGELSNSVALAEGTWLISNSLALVLYTHVLQAKEPEKEYILTFTYTKLCFILTFFALSILILIPSNLYTIVFGKDFGSIKLYILILFPGVLILAASNIIGHYLAANGEYRANNIKSTIGLIIVVAATYIMIPIIGKLGAVIATTLSYVISGGYLFYYYFKVTKTPISEVFKWKDLEEIWTKRKEINS